MSHVEEDTDTDQALVDQGRVLRLQAQELFRIAENIREQAQKLLDQAVRTAQILADDRAARVKNTRRPRSFRNHLP